MVGRVSGMAHYTAKRQYADKKKQNEHKIALLYINIYDARPPHAYIPANHAQQGLIQMRWYEYIPGCITPDRFKSTYLEFSFQLLFLFRNVCRRIEARGKPKKAKL